MARWAFLIIVSLLAPLGAKADPIENSRIHVVDGDTIRIDRQQPDIQLMGFDAPEIRGARCDAEIDLGSKTAQRLRALLREGELEFSYVRCPCAAGTEGTAYCRRGRRCGILKSHGRNIGDVLIAEKLAMPLICGETRCPPSSLSWCRK